MIPGEIVSADGRGRAQRRRPRRRAAGRATPATGRSRSARTSTSPRPTRRCAFDRPAARGLPARRSPPARPCVSSRASSGRRAGAVSRGARLVAGSAAARSSGRRRWRELDRAALRRAVRPDRRRPGPPRRHRPVDRGRGGPLRRGPATRRCSAAARSIRESMGQSWRTRAEGAPDMVITGAVVLDHWGVVKADVGIRDGRIVALGKAGNPDMMDGVDPGAGDRPVDGDHRRQRADPHRRRDRLPRPPDLPADIEEALAAGITTIIGGGTGPAEGTKATTVTPGAWHLERMHEALDALAGERAAARQGQHRVGRTRCASRCSPAPAGSSCTRTGARPRPRSTRACAADATRRAGRAAHRHAERGRATSRPRSPRSPAGRSTRTTPRAPAAATRPTSSPSPA